MRRLWADPKFRARERERLGAQLAKNRADPEVEARRRAGIRAAHARPETKMRLRLRPWLSRLRQIIAASALLQAQRLVQEGAD